MAFDAEDLLDSIYSTVSGAIAAKCTAIEAEKIAKGKGLTGGLPAPESGAYYRQTWSDAILNETVAIFYGIEDIAAEGLGRTTRQNYKVFVEVIVSDSGMDTQTTSKVLRYTRALKEIFEEAFASVAEMGQIKIETLRPVSFKLDIDSSEELKVGGVSLQIALA